jgi:hypothetical protein
MQLHSTKIEESRAQLLCQKFIKVERVAMWRGASRYIRWSIFLWAPDGIQNDYPLPEWKPGLHASAVGFCDDGKCPAVIFGFCQGNGTFKDFGRQLPHEAETGGIIGVRHGVSGLQPAQEHLRAHTFKPAPGVVPEKITGRRAKCE